MCLKMYFNVQATTVPLHFELTEPWCFHHRNVWSWWACLQTRVSCYKHGGELWRLTWGKWKIVYLADNQWSYYVWSKKPNFFFNCFLMAAFIYEQLISDLQTLYASMGVQHTMNIYTCILKHYWNNGPAARWRMAFREQNRLKTHNKQNCLPG